MTNHTIIIMFGLFMSFLLIVFFISIISSTRKKSYHIHLRQVQDLTTEIKNKKAQLELIHQQIRNNDIDKHTMLPQLILDVLDVYENSNIRVPADIIEELPHMNLDTHKEVLQYIENQRLYWKLENTKKPFKGVLLK